MFLYSSVVGRIQMTSVFERAVEPGPRESAGTGLIVSMLIILEQSDAANSGQVRR
jgi:hypothetical protein